MRTDSVLLAIWQLTAFKDYYSKHCQIGINPLIFQKSHALEKQIFKAFIVKKLKKSFIQIILINKEIKIVIINFCQGLDLSCPKHLKIFCLKFTIRNRINLIILISPRINVGFCDRTQHSDTRGKT